MSSDSFYSSLKIYPWPLFFCLVQVNYFCSAVASVALQGAFCTVTLLTVSRWFVSLAPFLPSPVSPVVPAFIWPNTTHYTLDLKAWVPDYASFANESWATCHNITTNVTAVTVIPTNVTAVTGLSTMFEASRQVIYFYTELGNVWRVNIDPYTVSDAVFVYELTKPAELS